MHHALDHWQHKNRTNPTRPWLGFFLTIHHRQAAQHIRAPRADEKKPLFFPMTPQKSPPAANRRMRWSWGLMRPAATPASRLAMNPVWTRRLKGFVSRNLLPRRRGARARVDDPRQAGILPSSDYAR